MVTNDEDLERFQEIFKRLVQDDVAGLYHSTVSSDQDVRKIVIDLTLAKLSTQPYRIGFGFKSFYVYTATDANVSVNIRLGTQDSYNDPVAIAKGNYYKHPFPLKEAFLDWSAQSGKTITIYFFTRGDFATNVQSLAIAGQVAIGDGTSVETQTTATVTTAAVLFAADSTRIKMQIVNNSGVTIYLGDSAVTDSSGVKIGIPVAPGAQYAWENTAACYAVSEAAASTGQKIGLTKFS